MSAIIGYLFIVLLALLPAIFLVSFIYKKDEFKQEPWTWIAKAVWYGVLSAILVITVGQLVPDMPADTIFGSAWNAFVCAAGLEESAKLFLLWLLLRKNPHFDERMDGIVYACCVGMGFAGLENIFYLLSNLDSLMTVAITRGVLSVPGHFFYAVFMGYFYSLAFFGSSEHKTRNLLLAWAIPVLVHGAFDFALMVMAVNEGLATAALIAFYYVCKYTYKHGRIKMNEMLAMDENEIIQE